MTPGPVRSVPAAAPGRLYVVQRFLNTLHVEKGLDAFDSAAQSEDWLGDSGLAAAPGTLSAAARTRLRDLRGELRALAGDGEPDRARFGRLAGRARLRPDLDDDGRIVLTPEGGGPDRVLGELVVIALEAQRDGTWSRLKLCRHDDCRWAFYDLSRNRTGTWCAMGICGNRTKVAGYRQRRLS